MSLIDLQDVRVKYRYVEALRGINLNIESGAVGLLGPNGAGKSTLLKTLLGFLRPSSGTASVFGFSMPEHAIDVRQRLGYMPERDIVSPKSSAVAFLTYCGQLAGMTRVDAMERAHEVLNYVGMGDNRYRKMETYSTGMCQRVKFAQALIHDPKLLLLDEPTNGLDPAGRVEMLDLVRELALKRKVTLLLCSHLLPDVQYVCERVVIIAKGNVVVDGKISDLTKLHDGLFEVRVRDNKREFMALMDRKGLSCHDQQTGNLLVTCSASFNGGQDPERVMFESAQAVGTQLRHMRPVRQSLEEIFMRALGHTEAGQPQA